jgi:hypothetical protein
VWRVAHAIEIEGGDTITKRPFCLIAPSPLDLDAKPVVAQRTTDYGLGVLRATARVSAPPLPPSFAPIAPHGRYW